MNGFKGLFAATLTPFDAADRLNVGVIRSHTEFLIEAGVAGLCPCGTTGEFLYLSTGEKVRLIEETVAAANRRCTVLAGVWALRNKEVALLARAAEAAGADGVFLPPPIYYPSDDETIFRWYAHARESSGLPIFAYNIAAYAANAISIECIERLVGEGIIAGIKDSTGNAERMTELVNGFGERIAVMAASDGFVAESRKIGAHGFISALANVFPKTLLRIWEGDDSLQLTLSTVRGAVKQAGGIAALKRLLAHKGYSYGGVRIPGSERSSESLDLMDAALRDAGSNELE